VLRALAAKMALHLLVFNALALWENQPFVAVQV